MAFVEVANAAGKVLQAVISVLVRNH